MYTVQNENARGKPYSVLVMGGLGFIGSHLCRRLHQSGHRVTIFDKLYTSRALIADFEAQVDIIESDVRKTEDVVKSLVETDVVIDLVHTTVPGSSMQNPAYDVESNIVSHVNWLSQLNRTKVRKIIYISSGGTVYGVPQTVPIKETHPTEPISSYGITKLAVEKYIAMYASLYGIKYCICRPANAYGQGQRLNIGQGVVGVFLDRAVRGLPIEIWGNGNNKRDYIYISDLVNAISVLLNYEGNENIFNISTSVGHSLNDIVELIRNDLQLEIDVRYTPSRGFDVPENILSNTLLVETTGWQPEVNIHDGIKDVYGWLMGETDGNTGD